MTTYMDAIFDIPSTAHIWGGACIGSDAESGVIDKNFEMLLILDIMKFGKLSKVRNCEFQNPYIKS